MTYSRSNEDQVIADLLERVNVPRKVCVDIGAKSVEFSNVARLIVEDGWKGILIDRGIKGFHTLFEQTYAWQVSVIRDTVTPVNVNDLVPKSFGLLSIDIDGQDYYVWQAMKARPPIVCIEYNRHKAGHYVVPRNDGFEWKKAKDYTGFGASRVALERLGNCKGYTLVDANDDNLFFILGE